MNFKRVINIYKKELLEMLRDKRTLVTSILLPVVLYPIIFIGFSSLMSRQTAKLEEKGAVVAINDSTDKVNSSLILKELKKIKNFTYLAHDKTTQQKYLDKKIDAVISLHDSLSNSDFKVILVSLQYDKSGDKGRMVADKLQAAFKGVEKELVIRQVQERGINIDLLAPIKVTEHDTATSQKKLGSILGIMLPYMLIMMLIAGASVVATDLVAGEKERRTLETLLVSSAHRTEIVFGKYLTTVTFALLNVLINLFSLFFSMRYLLGQSGIKMAGVSFPFHSFILVLIILVPLATLYAAILLSVSTFSRNVKEAKTYEQPIYILSMLLAMISFFPAIEITSGMALIPVINFSLLFKAIMIGEYKLLHFFITLLSTLILDFVAIFFTIRLFNSESVLFRSDVDTNVKEVKKHKEIFFTPIHGVVYFLIALIVLFYLGSYLQNKDLARGLFHTQLLIILLPVLIILKLIKADQKEVLRFKQTNLVNFLLVPFIAISAAILVELLSQVINAIYPFPKDYLEKMNSLLHIPKLNLWQIFVLISILPGICEEILFRGFLIRFFEEKGQWFSISVTALLFSIFHLDPFKFIPVLLLGFLIGWLVVKANSIYVGMLSHMINNAFALSLAYFSNSTFLRKIVQNGDNLPYYLAPIAIGTLFFSLSVYNKINKEKKE